MASRVLIIISIIFCSLKVVSVEAAEWEHLENCELVPSFLNDGDSFLIQHGDQESVFRLYFVDCPEVSEIFPERVAEQADYYGVSKKRAVELGEYSADFAADFLKGKFSVHTQWKDAFGQAKRYAAIVVKDGKTLSEALTENGLVRIHGFSIDGKWNGRDSDSIKSRLRLAEKRAKRDKLGGWADPDSPIKSSMPPKSNLQPRRSVDTALDDLVNLNLASSKELEDLPAVGPTIAQRIIDSRPYKDVESIRKVPGIGPQTMLQLKPLVTVINALAPEGTADHFRKSPRQFLNRQVDVYIDMVVDVNWPAPNGFVVLQANTAHGGEFGGAIPIFFPEEKLEGILRYYGDKPADEIPMTRAVFYRYNGEDVLVIPRK